MRCACLNVGFPANLTYGYIQLFVQCYIHDVFTQFFLFLYQFQSHQLFHILVIAAAFVHYHGISEMAMYRVTVGECTVPHEPITF